MGVFNLEQKFLVCGSRPFWGQKTPLQGGISDILQSDVYITICNSKKIAVMN